MSDHGHHHHQHDLTVKKVERLSPTKVKLIVEFPAGVLDSHEKGSAEQYARGARIPGFRPGKAPVKMILDKYRDEIRRDVISHLVQAALRESLTQTKLNPLTSPTVKFKDVVFGENKPFEFEFEFEVHPEIELRDYKGISVKSTDLEVPEKEIDDTIGTLRERFATLEPTESTKGEKGLFGIVEIGFELTGEGMDRKQERKPFTIEMGAGNLVPELEAALLEMSVGEERKVPSRFPDDYTDKDLAGREAMFDCKLIEIKKKVLPEINDEFAQSVRQGLNLTQLREEIHKSISEAKSENNRRSHRDQILAHLVKSHSFELPESLVREQAEKLLESVNNERKRDKQPPLQAGEPDAVPLVRQAEQMVRATLLLSEIAHKEKIVLNEDRVEQRINEIASQIQRPLDETKKWLEGRNLLPRIQNEVLTDQVFDFLVENAQVTPGAKSGKT